MTGQSAPVLAKAAGDADRDPALIEALARLIVADLRCYPNLNEPLQEDSLDRASGEPTNSPRAYSPIPISEGEPPTWSGCSDKTAREPCGALGAVDCQADAPPFRGVPDARAGGAGLAAV